MAFACLPYWVKDRSHVLGTNNFEISAAVQRPSATCLHHRGMLLQVYNLCRKSAKAGKIFCREGVPEAIAGLLQEMREVEATYFHPEVRKRKMAEFVVAIAGACL